MNISVALCTYNGENYIEEQLRSILEQSVSVDEIVVCDDGSTDNTIDIADKVLTSGGISYRILKNEKSLGVSNNFLKALKMSTGDYVFTCDQDDIWDVNKVKVFMAEVKKSRKDLYFSNGILIDSKGNSLGSSLWDAYLIDIKTITEKPLMEALLKRPIVTGAAMLVSREIINRIDFIPEGVLHDEWFSMIAAASNSIHPLAQTTFFYRQHGNNVVGAKRESFFERFNHWLNGFRNLPQLRHKLYLRSKALVIAAQNTPYHDLTVKGLDFWNTAKDFESLTRRKQLATATKCLIDKQYHMFYTGYRGYLRDVLSVFVRQNKCN